MANKKLFRSVSGRAAPAATAVNEAGGLAYALAPNAALAQYAATGCLNGTYYAAADKQLGTVLALCAEVEPAFIARTAVYCRERGFMKDVPALRRCRGWCATSSVPRSTARVRRRRCRSGC
jgi:60 kDa SS-A/Ro ribonucleoprotein